jgi:alpha-galactosidase
MQQYNSWNGVVWRNDPDHCDVFPGYRPPRGDKLPEAGAVRPANNECILRPALASIAGCLLMLSDRPEVYRDERNLVGVRRSAPVLFTVPGQLYDFDPVKTDKLKAMERTDIRTGAGPSPIDGDQKGVVCQWWLNEIDTGFAHWNVLHRLNWSNQERPAQDVAFADLGLDSAKSYIVYEFWTGTMLGRFRGTFAAGKLGAMDLCSYAIHEQLDRPQLVSTNRHLTQGGVDLASMQWDGRSLSGRSRVIAADRYELVFHVPKDYKLEEATCDGQAAEAHLDGETLRLSVLPARTQGMAWKVTFKKDR